MDPARRNVVEFRHRSWWDERVYAAFRASRSVFCSYSVVRLPDELVKTADDVYVRFHGSKQWYRHDYTQAELAVWAGKIRASGAPRIWAYLAETCITVGLISFGVGDGLALKRYPFRPRFPCAAKTRKREVRGWIVYWILASEHN